MWPKRKSSDSGQFEKQRQNLPHQNEMTKVWTQVPLGNYQVIWTHIESQCYPGNWQLAPKWQLTPEWNSQHFNSSSSWDLSGYFNSFWVPLQSSPWTIEWLFKEGPRISCLCKIGVIFFLNLFIHSQLIAMSADHQLIAIPSVANCRGNVNY